MTALDTVSVPLALHDLLPVALATVGAVLVALRTRWTAALLAAGMIGAGGLAKASWKLLAALDIGDWPRLADALFPLMGPGFVLLAAAAWGRRHPAIPVVCASCAAVGIAVPALADAFLPVAVAGVTALYLALGRDARRAGDGVTVALLAAGLVATCALGPLSAGEQTITAQWLEQWINTVNQGAFALAAWRLGSPARRPAAQVSR
jgi:hypothetical protein